MKIPPVRVVKKGGLKRFNRSNVEAAPKEPGTYCFFNQNWTYIYVGSSVNLRQRLLTHYNNPKYNVHFFRWAQTRSPDDAKILERVWIKRYGPVQNIT